MNKLLGVVVILVLATVGAGAFYYWQYLNQAQPDAVTLELPAQPQAALDLTPTIQHPIPDDPAEPVALQPPPAAHQPGADPVTDEPLPQHPLPALDASDPDLLSRLGGLFQRQTLETVFNTDGIIRRVVMTVDNLPRGKLSMRRAINRATAGPFLTRSEADKRLLDPANYHRYTPFIRTMEAFGSDEMVSLYVRFYPLFQQAYEELGYPSAYFNDRLVEVIDHLLAAPQVSGSIQLLQPHVFYTFADPELEALSAGHKLMIRVGPSNAARIKNKLRELRQKLATGSS